MKTKIIVLGGKGIAVDIAEHIVEAEKKYGLACEFMGFAVDDPQLGDSILGYPVLCKTREAKTRFPQSDVKFIFSLYKGGAMKERVALLRSYEIEISRFASFVHPTAFISPSVDLGHANVIMAHAVLRHSVKLGAHNIICPQVGLSHDAIVGDSNLFTQAVCIGGQCTLGSGIVLGLNATVRNEVSIGDFAYIGMGAVVTKDVPNEAIVKGNPGKW